MQEQRWFSGHTHLKMSWIKHQINQKDSLFTFPPPLIPSPPSSYVITTNFHKESPSASGTKISPAVLFVIVILAVLFFISGLLHLLVRFLTKTSPPSVRRNAEASTSDALQRQLQQLFHLHDSGLDQAFIDALPVFSYKEVVGPKVGPKEPFDCAVCLCEFSENDQLRLLPMCTHAFHINCIDTWLLSNSTCPLCRGTLFNPGFSIENPIFDYDDFREEDVFPSSHKRVEIEEAVTEKGVFPVRLGKFWKLDETEGAEVGGETSSSKLDARRCYSMGSYQYVVGDANLRVALGQCRAGHQARPVIGTEQAVNAVGDEDTDGKKISISAKTDSYSVSKIWLWSNKGKFAGSSNARLDDQSPPNLGLPRMDRTECI